jgi:hypothetical protein
MRFTRRGAPHLVHGSDNPDREYLLWENATAFIRNVLGVLVSGLFFLAAKRSSGKSFGLGIMWLTFLIVVSLSDFDTVTTEQYSDPLFMGVLWLLLGIFACGIVSMAC